MVLPIVPTPPKSVSGPLQALSAAATALTPLILSTYTSSDIQCYINGRKTVIRNPSPDWTLLDYIRAQPTLKGTKLGCGEGGCGACTVVLQVGDKNVEPKRVKHVAVNACLYPLIGIDGKHVITIEGIGTVDKPHPLQERLAKLHGSQCGFCTPGIVMSLYAVIRNAYNPGTDSFDLTENEVEFAGHLDGNLCRCTGYKQILKAAKTFITQDLHRHLTEDNDGRTASDSLDGDHDELELAPGECENVKPVSCGRPGGCCKDDDSSMESKSQLSTPPTEPVSNADDGQFIALGNALDRIRAMAPKVSDPRAAHSKMTYATVLADYIPGTELIYPPALWKYQDRPICYGDENRIWFKPTTMEHLVELKAAYPPAKIIGGASEVQVEVHFKNSQFPVSVYISDIRELKITNLPSDEELKMANEIVLAANTPLTVIESVCKKMYSKLGRRSMVLKALEKQLRYFAGRQIRNVASLAGNIVTASPISDINPVLIASGATLEATSKPERSIIIPADTFWVGYRKSVLPSDAILTRIHIPLLEAGLREVFRSYKQAKRKDDDIAIVNAVFRIKLDSSEKVEEACFVYGGMAPTTKKAIKSGETVIGRRWTSPETLEAILIALGQEFDLLYSVPGGMAHFRKTLALSLFVRFWHESILDLDLKEICDESIFEIERNLSAGSRDDDNPSEQRIVGKQIPHLSALKQCTGQAEYIGDTCQDRQLYGSLVISSNAHAKLISVDWTGALELANTVGYIDWTSVSEQSNVWGSITKDEPFFARHKVFHHGQVIGMVYAETRLDALKAAKAVKIEYEGLPVVLSIDEAIKENSFFPHGRWVKKGLAVADRMKDIWATCYRTFEGTTKMGGQEHFYLETNVALAIPSSEDDQMEIWSSTQNTMETQEFVSRVLGIPHNRVNVRVKRMGGAFGGKESRSIPFACYAAIAARKERRPVQITLNRDEDMLLSGQRHPFQARWKVGVTGDGKLIALEADVYNNAGFSHDMSGAVMDRCVTHFDNCYEIPHVHIRGHVCKTNTHSNTAFRGFGAPQGMFFAEMVMHVVAEGLGMHVDELRRRNLYQVGHHTPFCQQIDHDWHIPLLLDQLSGSCNYERRKVEIARFNTNNRWKKRGISFIPTKFGLSFATALHLNQASATVRIFQDGSVLLHHGGTEMGQGLYTKMCQIAAEELGVPLEAVYTQDSQTYQTANASPTAASSGSDLNGMAVRNACDQLNKRLQPYRERYGEKTPFRTIIEAAYLARVDLSAQGFWKMPRIGYQWGVTDPKLAKPMYYYFTQGAAVSEVELDLLTGDHTVLRTDIMMDIGNSINPALDYGQIEGAFVQGLGLFTIEESLWSPSGQLITRGPGTYKIPTFNSIPQTFNVSLLREDSMGNALSWNHLRSVQSSKGVGEPPLFLGSTVFFALREAVKAAREMNGVGIDVGGVGREWEVDEGVWPLSSPATAEKLRLAVGDDLVRRARVERKGDEKGFSVTVA